MPSFGLPIIRRHDILNSSRFGAGLLRCLLEFSPISCPADYPDELCSGYVRVRSGLMAANKIILVASWHHGNKRPCEQRHTAAWPGLGKEANQFTTRGQWITEFGFTSGFASGFAGMWA